MTIHACRASRFTTRFADCIIEVGDDPGEGVALRLGAGARAAGLPVRARASSVSAAYPWPRLARGAPVSRFRSALLLLILDGLAFPTSRHRLLTSGLLWPRSCRASGTPTSGASTCGTASTLSSPCSAWRRAPGKEPRHRLESSLFRRHARSRSGKPRPGGFRAGPRSSLLPPAVSRRRAWTARPAPGPITASATPSAQRRRAVRTLRSELGRRRHRDHHELMSWSRRRRTWDLGRRSSDDA